MVVLLDSPEQRIKDMPVLSAALLHNPHRFLYFYGLAALVFLLTRRTADPDEGKIGFGEQSKVAPVYLDLRNEA
jgi:hypothetical protein